MPARLIVFDPGPEQEEFLAHLLIASGVVNYRPDIFEVCSLSLLFSEFQ